MNILIVYSHPSKKSYTFHILETLQKLLTEQNWNIEISDLYAMNFRCDMSEQEYEREGFAKTELPIPSDLKDEHRKIENADCIIFLYPVWWSDCPAILKGWFDRVYTVGYAYKENSNLQRMKTVKCGIVLCTAGHPNDLLKATGISESMERIMLNDRLGERFENKEMLILGGTTLDSENFRFEHKLKIEGLVIKIKQYFA